MIKTVWIESQFQQGKQEQELMVNGSKLANDTENALNELELDGYELVSITPILSGRYGYVKFDGRVTTGFMSKPTISPDTCASWGYSVTDGLIVVGRKKTKGNA